MLQPADVPGCLPSFRGEWLTFWPKVPSHARRVAAVEYGASTSLPLPLVSLIGVWWKDDPTITIRWHFSIAPWCWLALLPQSDGFYFQNSLPLSIFFLAILGKVQIESQMDELSALFDVADFNNDGSVDKYELSGALKSIGILDKTERGKKRKEKKRRGEKRRALTREQQRNAATLRQFLMRA